MVGAFVGVFVGIGGYLVELWQLFLPDEWLWGAGWWAPILACVAVGAIMGAVKGPPS